jgi:hypothetical protein
MKTAIVWLLVLVVVSMIVPYSFVQAADFKTGGDWGCKQAAMSNLKNAGLNKAISFFGLGDYLYSCSPSTLWNSIPSKKGVMGNHECEKGQGTSWAASTFGNGGCGKGYFAVTRGGDTGVIGLNPYTSYKKGSSQYNYVVSKTNEYKNNTNINWIVYLIHPLFYPVGCSQSHCHGVDNPGFNSVYEPIIKASGKGFILQAHTHLSAFGTPKGIPSAICGGGGEDSTKLGSLNGYTWASSTPGYCLFHFELGKATAQLIGTNNQVVHTHTWKK